MPNKTRRIKDWDKFQHYKSGDQAENPKWIKLYKRLLDDLEWHNLPGDDAKVLVELWMLASENGGTLPPLKKICFRLRRSEKTILSILERLPHWIETTLDELYTNSIPEEEGDKKEKENKNENVDDEFVENFWPAYPHKVGKPDALKSFKRQRLFHSLETILSGLSRYVSAKPPDRNWLNPSTFLNQERFLDQPATVAQGPPAKISYMHDALKRNLERATNGIGRIQGRGSGGELGSNKLLADATGARRVSSATDGIILGGSDRGSEPVDEPG